MVKIEGKKSIYLFFVFLYLPSIALFLLSGSRNLSDYISTSFYISLTIASLVVLALIKSDNKYYQNLNLTFLIWAIIVGFAMIGLSWGLSISLEQPNMLLSVNSGIIPLEATTMTLTSMPTSITTTFLSTIVYGLVMAATSEELFKLAMFAEGKQRWGKGYRIGKVTVPGVLVYVGFPVGFWAALHGIQAYSNPVMIIPAAVNGIILIIYLWKTRCILGAIFAHWLYNSGITLITYINGSVDIVSGTPLFPNPWDRAYYSNSGFIYDGFVIVLLVMGIFFFLLPSLTREKGKRQKTKSTDF